MTFQTKSNNILVWFVETEKQSHLKVIYISMIAFKVECMNDTETYLGPFQIRT